VQAEAAGVRKILTESEPETALDKIRELPEARGWLERFQHFLDVYGNRVVAAHLDVTSPTWREDPTPVLDTSAATSTGSTAAGITTPPGRPSSRNATTPSPLTKRRCRRRRRGPSSSGS